MTISHTDSWYYLRSLTGRPFYMKHCDFCGHQTDAGPDAAFNFRIVCGACASRAYAKFDFNPALDKAQAELDRIHQEQIDVRTGND